MKKIAVMFSLLLLASLMVLPVTGSVNYSDGNSNVYSLGLMVDGSPRPPLPPRTLGDGAPRPPLPPASFGDGSPRPPLPPVLTDAMA